jgi:hypothetical protein
MSAHYEAVSGNRNRCQCSFFRFVFGAHFGQYFYMAEELILYSATGAHENVQLV